MGKIRTADTSSAGKRCYGLTGKGREKPIWCYVNILYLGFETYKTEFYSLKRKNCKQILTQLIVYMFAKVFGVDVYF